MKSPLLLIFTVLLAGDAVAQDQFAFGAGVSLTRIPGSRTYGTVGATQSSTGHQLVPFIELAYRPDPRFRVALTYASLAGLDTDRVAPTSDIFGEGGIALTVLTPYRVEEDIHQLSLAPGITIPLAERWKVEVGPSLDAFFSRAAVTVSRGAAAGRHFSATDYRLGARLSLDYRVADGWGLALLYRYAAPPDRRAHSLGMQLAREF